MAAFALAVEPLEELRCQAKRAAEQTTKDAEAPERDGPVLDLTDAAVKRMIKSAKARGYVTYDQLNAVLPSDEVTSERIEDIMAMLSEMGINVVESDEAEEEGETEPVDATDEDEGRAIAPQSSVPATTTRAEPTDRTDDPVRMYLREMGSVELLSREGEIAIAKRIEAGHEAMIAGLCESPLTFHSGGSRVGCAASCARPARSVQLVTRCRAGCQPVIRLTRVGVHTGAAA